MNARNRLPSGIGILLTLFLILLTLAGCEKGTLGLKGGSISGAVLDSRTLAGVSGVNVTAVSASEGTGGDKATKYTTTDSRGSYYLSDMRAGEWTLMYDKVGYQPITEGATGTVNVVVVNNEHRSVPEVRMVQTYANQYVLIRGILKDANNGTVVTLGTAQYIFGQQTFNNRLPTELQTGFSVPVVPGDMEVRIQVTGYEPYTTVITNAVTDRDLGVILLRPQTYSITGVWRDVPGWVFQDNPTANIFAYAGNRIVATATSTLNSQNFQVVGIPMGTSVSLEIEIKGYRMNGAIPVVPNSDFQGTIYQTVSLKNNFSPIMRDVRVIVTGSGIGNNERIGAYCNETGTVWPTTIVTTSGVFGLGAPRVIDLGVNQVPTGYTLTFTGYNVDDGTVGTTRVLVNDDGVDPQIVTVLVN
jgi:hypothetical protein